MSMEKVRIHYIFHGTVQGVGFRYKACYSAKKRRRDRLGEELQRRHGRDGSGGLSRRHSRRYT